MEYQDVSSSRQRRRGSGTNIRPCLVVVSLFAFLFVLFPPITAMAIPLNRPDQEIWTRKRSESTPVDKVSFSVKAILGDESLLPNHVPHSDDLVSVHVLVSLSSPSTHSTTPFKSSSKSRRGLMNQEIILRPFIPWQKHSSRHPHHVPSFRVLYEPGDGSGQVQDILLHSTSTHHSNFQKQDNMDDRPSISLKTNALGRASFTILLNKASMNTLLSHSPLERQKHGKTLLIPILFFQSPKYHLPSEWFMAFIDDACLWQVSRSMLDAHVIQSMSSSLTLSYATAERTAESIDSAARAALYQRSHQPIVASGSSGIHIVRTIQGQFDPKNNQVPVYLIQSRDYSDSGLLFASQSIHRILLGHHQDEKLAKREEKSLNKPLFFNESIFFNSSGPSSALNINVTTVSSEEAWALSKGKDGLHIYTTICDVSKVIFESILETVSAVWRTIMSILHRIGIQIFDIFRHVREFFSWRDVLNTQQFLDMYYRLLAPRAFFGLDLIRKDYRSLFKNVTLLTQDTFNQVIHHYGGQMTNTSDKDVTLQDVAIHLTGNTPSDSLPFNSSDPLKYKMGQIMHDLMNATSDLLVDPQTLYLQDRIIGNLQYAELIVKQNDTSPVNKFYQLLRESGRALIEVLDAEQLRQFLPHFNKLNRLANHPYEIGLSHIFSFVQSISLLAENVLGHAIDALIALMPAYWEAITILMFTEVRIPFVQDLWKTQASNLEFPVSFSVIDVFTLFGSMFATSIFKLAIGGAPFTEMDIQVLTSCHSPELLVYTWNTHPLTSVAGNNSLAEFRLGVYDWIPRSQIVALTTFFDMWFDFNLYYGSGEIWSPGSEVMLPQVFGAIAAFMEQIYEYPFTQLATPDEEAVKYSVYNPDDRFLWFWACTIGEQFVKSVQPFVPGWMDFPMNPILNFVTEGLPLLHFGVRIQIDALDGVSPDDVARHMVVNTEWLYIVLKTADLLMPFFPVPKTPALYASLVFDLGQDVLDLCKVFMMERFRVVGLLSSSFQGNASSFSGVGPAGGL